MKQALSILAAYAHPDDEQGVSGLLAKYAEQGVMTSLVCATRGEVGEIAPGVEATPETLGQVRERELQCTAAKIGLDNLYFLDYRDSGMAGTPENEDPQSLHQANILDVAGKLVRIIRRQKPQVIVTFDSFGGYGHPDHIKIHQAALIAYFTAGDPRCYPEQLQNGLEPWAPLKLYWTAFTKQRFQAYFDYLKENQIELQEWMQEFLKRAVPDEAVTTVVDVKEYVDVKWEALFCHASQMNPNSPFGKLPPEVRREGMRQEMLVCGESRVGRISGVEHDVFEGIREQQVAGSLSSQ